VPAESLHVIGRRLHRNRVENSQGPPDTGSGPVVLTALGKGSVPGAIPALTLLTGVDFRIPQALVSSSASTPGLFDLLVLFIGGGVAYIFP